MTGFLKFFSFLLIPISLLWEWSYRLRRFFYNYDVFASNEYHVPIISIGNVTFGGTGKTPFTMWLSEYLETLEKDVLILMRGYKGKLEHSSGIIKADRRLGFNPKEYGDEALLLARRLKNASIVVGKKRSKNLDYYFPRVKPDVVLLDDGHQHLKIKRNLNIVLFDALMPLNRYKVAPRGYMREGFRAMLDADLVIIGRVDQVDPTQLQNLKNLIFKNLPTNLPVAEMRYRPRGFYSSTYQKKFHLKEITGKKVICVAGIASPVSFFNLIDSLGAEIIKTESFPDHHDFNQDDLADVLKLADEHDAYIVTTEKDMVKMRKIAEDPRILYLEIQVEFLNGEDLVKKAVDEVVKL